MPSRPGELHPEPLTDPDLTLSRHPARATARRLPPSVENWSPSFAAALRAFSGHCAVGSAPLDRKTGSKNTIAASRRQGRRIGGDHEGYTASPGTEAYRKIVGNSVVEIARWWQ